MMQQVNTIKQGNGFVIVYTKYWPMHGMAHVDYLQQQAQALGKSKSEVLRMGLDALRGRDDV